MHFAIDCSVRMRSAAWSEPHFHARLQVAGFDGGGGAAPPGPITRPFGSVSRTRLPLGAPFFCGWMTAVTLSFGLSMLLFHPVRVSIPGVPASRLHSVVAPLLSGTRIWIHT